jgi:hypothetical protein
MITVIQRSESDTAGIGEGSLCCAVVRGASARALLAGSISMIVVVTRTLRAAGRTAPSLNCAKNSSLSKDGLRRRYV